VKPFRTALFAPGSNERVMAKAMTAGADAVILDLEDSVALTAKQDARRLVAAAITAMTAQVDGALPGTLPICIVRVNALETSLTSDDMVAVVRPGLDAIMIPKAEDPAAIAKVSDLLADLEKDSGMRVGSIVLILMIESALGVVRCFDLARCSPRIAGICIGSARDGDLQTDLGAAWSRDGMEMFHARAKVLLDTRAAGQHLLVLDGVFSDLNDEDGLEHDSSLSARLGYTGRTVIHPKQIPAVRRAYAVAKADLAYYRKVDDEFSRAEAAGLAVITVEGKLVDYAMAERARRVLQLAALDPPE
jgi:citrate lyase subunit beta/citryl-CoA lyase